MTKSFEQINRAYNQTFQPGSLSLGLFFPIEAYQGSIATMQNQVQLAQTAEEIGFTALWVRDIPLHVPEFGDAGQVYDPWVYLSHIGSLTKQIGLATGSIILPLRHPIHVAKSATSIDNLFGGRLIMGVASGDRPTEYAAFNRDVNERNQRFSESFNFIRALNDDFPRIISSIGELTGNDLLPKSYGKRLPMLVTGHSGGQSLQWIAETSDGWIYYPRPIGIVQQMVSQWRSLLRDLSLPDKPFAQSFYLDLHHNPDFLPTPIHLGYRLGRNAFVQLLQAYREAGVNHIILNLKYGRRPALEVLNEIANYVLPGLQ